MVKIEIPGRKDLELKNIVLDFNGTIAKDGELLPGVISRLNKLSEQLNIHILTADTFGTARKACKPINCKINILESSSGSTEKKEFIKKIGADNTVSVGNGTNDGLMLREAVLGIFVIEAEGSSLTGMLKADIVTKNIEEALDMLLHPKRLIATLRV
ncbi:MAG: ATPase P [Clostridiales bacterium]|nr:ATPase P [Clostridiales bacterium]MCF8021995.1 ATPase P [Clostridiales bacterium]